MTTIDDVVSELMGEEGEDARNFKPSADTSRPADHPFVQTAFLQSILSESYMRKSHWELDVDRLPFRVLDDEHPLISGAAGGAARVELQEFLEFDDAAMAKKLGLAPVFLWLTLKGGTPLNERTAEGLGVPLEPLKLALSAMWAAMEGIRAVSS